MSELGLFRHVGPHVKTSKFPPLESQRKIDLQPSTELNQKRNTTDLTRRGNSNVPAIIPAFAVPVLPV